MRDRNTQTGCYYLTSIKHTRSIQAKQSLSAIFKINENIQEITPKQCFCKNRLIEVCEVDYSTILPIFCLPLPER